MTSMIKRILFISSTVFSNEEDINQYLYSRNIIPIVYDWENITCLLDLYEMIPSTLDKATVSSIGIMYHNQCKNTLHMFQHDKRRSTIWGNLKEYTALAEFVRLLIADYKLKEVDIISCGVVDSSQGTVLNTLGQSLKVKINASINDTGGSNGDWILEEGNVKLIGRYFKVNIKGVDFGMGGKQNTGGIYNGLEAGCGLRMDWKKILNAMNGNY